MQESIKEKVLYTAPRFDVIDRDGYIGLRPKDDSVIILPYVTDENNLPISIGVLRERNNFREGGYSLTVVSGRTDDDDSGFLETAKRELKEETGFSVTENDKWFFLGTVTASKMVDTEHPCFAVNVTGIKRGTATTDGSENEKQSEFLFIPSNDVVKTKDVFIPALFLKLFKYVVGMDMYNRDDSVFGRPRGFTAEI
jgi:8-oxo-dGTP pyrophosphatase MutT (NUDIX family)